MSGEINLKLVLEVLREASKPVHTKYIIEHVCEKTLCAECVAKPMEEAILQEGVSNNILGRLYNSYFIQPRKKKPKSKANAQGKKIGRNILAVNVNESSPIPVHQTLQRMADYENYGKEDESDANQTYVMRNRVVQKQAALKQAASSQTTRKQLEYSADLKYCRKIDISNIGKNVKKRHLKRNKLTEKEEKQSVDKRQQTLPQKGQRVDNAQNANGAPKAQVKKCIKRVVKSKTQDDPSSIKRQQIYDNGRKKRITGRRHARQSMVLKRKNIKAKVNPKKRQTAASESESATESENETDLESATNSECATKSESASDSESESEWECASKSDKADDTDVQVFDSLKALHSFDKKANKFMKIMNGQKRKRE